MPGGHLHLDAAPHGQPAPATAVVAGRVDADAAPAAGRAGRRLHELAERRLRDVLDAAGAAALRALPSLRPGLGARRVAALASGDHVDRHLARDAERRLGQGQLDRGGRVAAPRPRAPAAREEVVAEERPEQVGQAREVHELLGVELGAGDAGVPEPVIPGSGVGIAQHLVRLGGLAKSLGRLGRRVHVGMELTRQPPERFLDVRIGGVPRDAQNVVVVSLCRHARSLRAGFHHSWKPRPPRW